MALVDGLVVVWTKLSFWSRTLTRRQWTIWNTRLKYNDSAVDPVSDEDMEKLFSGNVKKQKPTSSSSSSGSGNSPTENHKALLSGEDKTDLSALTSILDNHVATPYVYLYRRLDT